MNLQRIARSLVSLPAPRLLAMKEPPADRLPREVLEIVRSSAYDSPCARWFHHYTRVVWYRATFVSYRTTPLMLVPDQSSPVVPVDGTTSGGRQIGAAARTTGSIRKLDSLLPMGELYPNVPTKRIQSAVFAEAACQWKQRRRDC